MFKKYCFEDAFKYRNIGDIRNLFNGTAFNGVTPDGTDENYYKPIWTKSVLIVIASNMKAKGTKIKIT